MLSDNALTVIPFVGFLTASPDDSLTEFAVQTERFVSKKLSNKITQQLNDCLVLASMSLPDWCERLTKWCPMLFNYDLRSLYFNYTAYGTSRYVWFMFFLQFYESSLLCSPNFLNLYHNFAAR